MAEIERRAYKMVYFAVNDREEALDMVQEAMLRLVRRYADKNPDEWRPLFYRILEHLIQDHYRRQKVRSIVRGWFGGHDNADGDDEPDESETIASHVPDPLQSNIQSQAMQTLNAAVKSLPLRQQQVFLLRAWEGLDVKATAKAMGCSEGSVKTHYSRALEKLRETLGEYWP